MEIQRLQAELATARHCLEVQAADLKYYREQNEALMMKVGLDEEEIQAALVVPSDEGFQMRLQHSSFESFACAMVANFKDSGATNYLTITIHDPSSKDFYEVTMQKVGGETPTQQCTRLKAELAQLRSNG